jgi:hypothetical protein
MKLWLSPEEARIKRAVAGAKAKRQKYQYGEVIEIAEELDRNYDNVIDARTKFREARMDLEKLQAQAKVAQALGKKPPDLTSAKKNVNETEALLQAYEKQLHATERWAKYKYPDIFRFL